jgi:phytol kinase
MITPWLEMALVLGLLLLILTLLRRYQRNAVPHPELVRKVLHIAMGLVALSFPWLFDERWPVLTLAAITVPLLWALTRLPFFAQRIGQVLTSVGRGSWGEIAFPLSVVMVFVLSNGEPLLFCVPLLLLTFADAGAALVGIRWGRHRYGLHGKTKSIEGSLAFVLIAFVCVLVPLLCWGNVGAVQAVLLAAMICVLTGLAEAAIGNGLDNIVVPLLGLALLTYGLMLSLPALLASCVALIAPLMWVCMPRRVSRSTMRRRASTQEVA